MGPFIRKSLLVTLSAFLPLLVFEAILWTVDYRPTGWWRYEGFDRKDAIFVERQGQYALAPGQELIFRTRPFPAHKSGQEVRILSVGDSIAWGFQGNHIPEPLTAYSDTLERILNEQDEGVTYQVLNMGARTYSSTRVLQVVKQVLKHDPDLVMGSFGTSEFLEHSIVDFRAGRGPGLPSWLRPIRIVQFLGDQIQRFAGNEKGLTSEGVRERDESLRSPFVHEESILKNEQERAHVYGKFRDNLHALADACAKQGVPLVLLTVPCNLRWPPFASVFVDETSRLDAETAVQRAGALLERGNHMEALSLLGPAVQRHPGVSALWFRLGEAYDARGEKAKAKEGYSMARDLDGLPLRATDPINRIIRRAAADRDGVHVVDMERLFDGMVPDAIPDDRLFLDNNHPLEPVHGLMAREIHRVLRREGLLGAVSR